MAIVFQDYEDKYIICGFIHHFSVFDFNSVVMKILHRGTTFLIASTVSIAMDFNEVHCPFASVSPTEVELVLLLPLEVHYDPSVHSSLPSVGSSLDILPLFILEGEMQFGMGWFFVCFVFS